MTRVYTSGGHTRVVERWVRASEGIQSLVIISQGERDVPPSLIAAVKEKNGEVFFLRQSVSSIENAKELREIASRFSSIVVHSDVHDPIPTVAFATSEFQRPIALFNHADHLPWIGCAIADDVVNFRKAGSEICATRRGIKNNHRLPLPGASRERLDRSNESRRNAKRDLGIAEDKPVIVTVASGYKYRPFDGINFQKTLAEILEREPIATAVIVGPDKDDPNWADLISAFGNRVRMVGKIPFAELSKIFVAADLAIDSFPLGSTTALLDFANLGVPALALGLPSNQYDAFQAAGIVCSTQAELIERVLQELRNGPQASLLSEVVESESSSESFAARVRELENSLSREHRAHFVRQDDFSGLSDFELPIAWSLVINAKEKRQRFLSVFRSVLTLYTYLLFPWLMPQKLFAKLDSYAVI